MNHPLRVLLGALICASVLAALTLPFRWEFAAGVALGGCASAVALWRTTLLAGSAAEAKTLSKAKMLYNFALKVVIFAGALFAVARFGTVAILGLFAGVTAALAGAVTALAFRNR